MPYCAGAHVLDPWYWERSPAVGPHPPFVARPSKLLPSQTSCVAHSTLCPAESNMESVHVATLWPVRDLKFRCWVDRNGQSSIISSHHRTSVGVLRLVKFGPFPQDWGH